MKITPKIVVAERDWIRDRAPVIVPLINDTRLSLGELFDTTVDTVTAQQYREEVDEVFLDGDRAVNVATYVILLREIDVEDDYPGFIVDEVLGRELAGTIAGGEPLAMLAEATFHYADSRVHYEEVDEFAEYLPSREAESATREPIDDDSTTKAGLDDLDAALAAGFQTRLPGWNWRETASPFAVTD